jgi:hypothetical protein
VVNRLPAPITGADSVCSSGGTALAYDADVPLGMWSSIGIGISPAGVISGLSPGVGTISYTLSTGCFVTKTIVVLPLPSGISGPAYVCLGGTITLSDMSGGGVWSTPGYSAFAVIDSFTGVVTGIANGSAVVTYTIPTGCIITRTITVNPHPSAIGGPSNVCAGASITLTDSVAGGQWSSSNTTIATVGSGSGIVTGVAGGLVTITYSTTSLCGVASVTQTVMIDPLPDAGTILGPVNICMTNTAVLSDPAPGGTWGASNTHAAISAGTVTPISIGIDTVTYIVTNGCGADTTTHIITISPQPYAGAISGPSEVCSGSAITLVDTAGGGAWSATNGSATVSVTGIVTGAYPGTDTIFYSVANACGTAIAAQVVTVNALPDAGTINGLPEVCINSTVTLTDNIPGGSWAASNGTATVADGIVKGLAAGRDTIRYTVANTCGTASTTQAITINPLPDAGAIIGADSICPGDTMALSATIAGGAWSSADTSIFYVAGTGSVIGKTPGKNNAIYTVINSCGAASAVWPITVRSMLACEGTQKFSLGCSGEGEIVIYPNPNPGAFNLKIISALTEEVHVVIINAIGQKVETFTATTNELIEVKMGVAPGVYIVSAITSHGRCSEKITVTR